MSVLLLTSVLFFLTLLVGGIAILYGISMYNSLVDLSNRVDKYYADIDTSLQRRNDEMNGLIEMAKSAMNHESDTLVQLAEAREQARTASTPKEEAEADQVVQQALMEFRSRVEDHPDLDAHGQLSDVMDRLSSIEIDIQDKRSVYNDAVTRYNTRIAQFPYVVVAQQLGYEDREHFEAEEEARQAPDYRERLNPESAA